MAKKRTSKKRGRGRPPGPATPDINTVAFGMISKIIDRTEHMRDAPKRAQKTRLKAGQPERNA